MQSKISSILLLSLNKAEYTLHKISCTVYTTNTQIQERNTHDIRYVDMETRNMDGHKQIDYIRVKLNLQYLIKICTNYI